MTKKLKYKNILLIFVIGGFCSLFLIGRYQSFSRPSLKNPDFWISQLKDNDYSIRMGAARILGGLKDRKAVPSLSSLLIRDDHLWVRVESAIALGSIGDTAAIDPLVLALDSNHPPVRREAATALGKIGDPKAVEFLITRLRKDNNHLVRIRIIEALGLLNDKQAVKAISPYLNDTDIWVRRVSYQALHRLQGI